MPQGGVDDGETPIEAACRELWEEVGTTKALLLRESAQWLTYEVPESLRPAPTGKAAGTARRSAGSRLPSPAVDSDIDITAHDQEFDAWQWVTAGEMLERIVPFKRATYDRGGRGIPRSGEVAKRGPRASRPPHES